MNSAVAQSFPSLSADGLELYFNDGFRETPDPDGYGDTDIWVLTRDSKGDLWNVPKNLGPTINSENTENSPCISADGLELYFMSSVPNNPGNSEIVMTTRLSKDDPWGEPVTLNTNVNRDEYEYTPFISADGLLLFFSRGYSKSHVYVCRRTSTADPWGPAEFFAPVNSGNADDIWSDSPGMSEYHTCFSDVDSTIYFTRSSDLFASDYDIWQVEVTPIVDLNSDGFVDAADICIIVDNWHTENILCDIAPPPLGDGFVDVQDLIVIAEHLFEDVRLIAHWKLDETEGDIAYDSARTNDAAVLGDPVWQPEGGQVGGALQFDGIDDYANADFVLNPSSNPFSVFAWIKGGMPGQVIISQTDGTGFGGTWLGANPADGQLVTNLMYFELASESVITDDQWHHVGLVWNGSRRSLYVDGQEVAYDTGGLMALSATGGLHIGSGKSLDAGTFFSGLIDDVRIYNRALGAEEIAQMVK